MSSNRKDDHISLTEKAQLSKDNVDSRFFYEPILDGYSNMNEVEPFYFLEKEFKIPMWASSMTGGAKYAKSINENIAKACAKFGFGMGLGSCRALIDDKKNFDDFNVRKFIGDDLPLYANLGIAQVEDLLRRGQYTKIKDLVNLLEVNGLIIHVNPLQEFLQPEGDRYYDKPIDTIKKILDFGDFPLIIKEVGQGMGPDSLKELLTLPLSAVEFGAFGGTNFSKLESIRSNDKAFLSNLMNIGHSAEEMVDFSNQIFSKFKLENSFPDLIISGGIEDYLHGYYLVQKSMFNSVYGQAGKLLKYAVQGYEPLEKYLDQQVEGYKIAGKLLRIRLK